MRLELTGRVYLVTGAGSGVGRATARILVEEGGRVALLDRDSTAGSAAADVLTRAGGDVIFVPADVADEKSIRSAVRAVIDHWGTIDGVVCCAGISGPVGDTVTEIGLDDWNAVMSVNVTGPFLTVKHTAPFLALACDPTVVLMASDSSFVAAPGMVPYNASKGAVLQLTRALSVDLGPSGIRVNCVCPSIVDTAMSRADLGVHEEGFANAGYPVQTAEEVANHIAYLCSARSRPVNGQSIVSDFGYLARSSFPA